jgi:hypothetical protein
MKFSGIAASAISLLVLFAGCTSGTYVATRGYQQEGSNGYCHKKIEPVGPSDLARPTHIGEGDYIDYYGPCDGPTMAELIHEQKRFERVRFERDFGDEG